MPAKSAETTAPSTSRLGRAAQVALGSQANPSPPVKLQAAASYVGLPRHRKTSSAPPQPPLPSTASSCRRAGRGQPALPLVPARKHPDTRPEHPESYCLSETAAGIQGWDPLYIAVISPLKQKGTRRDKYPLVKPPGDVHLVSQQNHTIQIEVPGPRQAASLLPVWPRAFCPQGCQHCHRGATADCWDRKRLPGFGETP